MNELAEMPIDLERVRSCYETAKELLLAERVDGHWVGQLSASALSTATAVSALSLVAKASQEGERPESSLASLIDGGVKYLVAHQNDDGGWGDTDKSYSNIATTYLAVAAIHLSNRACDFANHLERARRYIESQGGIQGLRD